MSSSTPSMSKKGTLMPEERRHCLMWLLVIACTILAIAVIITGFVIFVGYMILRPKLPYIRTSYAHLDKLDYDQYGNLDTQIGLNIEAVNENRKVHATFSDLSFDLLFDGVPIARLEAEPFDVDKNSTLTLPYLVQSSSIPLASRAMEVLNDSLKRDKISFHLKGDARTRWKVGIIGFVKFWTHLSCRLDFSTTNGTGLYHHCSSKSS